MSVGKTVEAREDIVIDEIGGWVARVVDLGDVDQVVDWSITLAFIMSA